MPNSFVDAYIAQKRKNELKSQEATRTGRDPLQVAFANQAIQDRLALQQSEFERWMAEARERYMTPPVSQETGEEGGGGGLLDLISTFKGSSGGEAGAGESSGPSTLSKVGKGFLSGLKWLGRHIFPSGGNEDDEYSQGPLDDDWMLKPGATPPPNRMK